jgi:hypothetical protein
MEDLRKLPMWPKMPEEDVTGEHDLKRLRKEREQKERQPKPPPPPVKDDPSEGR